MLICPLDKNILVLALALTTHAIDVGVSGLFPWLFEEGEKLFEFSEKS